MASRVCSAMTMERFIDPVVADLQVEYAAAIGRRRRWLALLAGYIAFAKVFLLCGLSGTRQACRNWSIEDTRGLSRVVGHTVVAITVVTMLLTLPQLLRLPDMALYLLPATLALSVPLGLAIGTALGPRRYPRSRRLIAALLLVAVMASVFSFANVGWLTPAFNQWYREEVFSRVYREEVSGVRSIAKGYNELTFTELRHAIDDPDARYALASFMYHTRLALAAAPLTFAMFGVVIATRRRVVCLGAIVLAAFGYYALLWLGNNWGVLSPLGPWIPQTALVLTTLAVGARRILTQAPS